ncbi:MAG: cytochrome b N-terminal domain-containing protein [Anaerolineales bacterium]
MFTKIKQWINSRWPLSQMLHLGLDEEIPGGSSFAYVLGSTTLIVFVVLVVTGIWQIFYYVPTVDHAYDSLNYLRTNVPFGWLIHGLHYWSASAMIVLILLHLGRVFIWGAYKRPREITWLAGVLLLLVTMGMSFTGAPLPWDERGYWAAEVGTSIAGSVPVIGDFAKRVLLGGSTMGQLTLSRFFILHVALLPGLLMLVLGIHLVAFRKPGSVGPWNEEKRAKTGNFWPDQVMKDAIVGVVVFVILIALVVFFPPPFAGPADPLDTTYIPKPEWNFLFLYEALKFFPGKLEILGTVGIPTIGILILVLLPFIDRKSQRNPLLRPYAMGIGLLVAVSLVGLTVAGFMSNPQNTQAASAVAGTPPASSNKLSSSARQGQQLFQTLGCTGCHSVNGSGGTAGPDLSNEGSSGRTRDWLIAQISNPKSHDPSTIMPAFSSLDNQQLNQLADYLLSLGSGSTTTNQTPAATSAAQVAPTATQVLTNSVSPAATALPTPTQASQATAVTNASTSNAGGPPGEAADFIGSAQHGNVLFSDYCARCHGPEGKGGVANPGSDDGDVPALNPIDAEFVNQNPQIFAENIDRLIQHGSTPPGPSPQLVMPAFGDTNSLTQQEISDIEAYVLQLNHVDRAQLEHPGLPPKQVFFITLAVFLGAGILLSVAWWFRR